MMFQYALYVLWILLLNCYAHRSYSQLLETSQSKTTTIEKHAPLTIINENLGDLRLSVTTDGRENQFKKSSDVIASAPRDSDDTSYSLNAKNKGVTSHQQKLSTYNDKPVSLNYTNNGTKGHHKVSSATHYQRIKQLNKLYSKEKKLLYKEDPKNKYKKVSDRYDSVTADETINKSTNDKDFLMNLMIENLKVPAPNTDPLHTKSPSLRSVSNDDFDGSGDFSDNNSDRSATLMPPPSYDELQSKTLNDPFRSYHPSSPENHRTFGRPGNRPGYRPGHSSGYRPGYRPASSSGNRQIFQQFAQQPGVITPIAASCNRRNQVGQVTPMRWFLDFPLFLFF